MAALGVEEVDAFYEGCPQLPGDVDAEIAAFFRHHAPDGRSLARPVVCVTSGGTTVPMERNCVRYIDNFSAGTRGAMSTQEFLEAGYAVIFLTRTGSVQPWTLDLPRQETVPLLQEILACSCDEGGGRDGVAVVAEHKGRVAALLRRVAAVQRQRLLLTIPFTTIFEYLQHLRSVARAAAPLGGDCMFYLAAAVSDFYIPWGSLAEHKIQSADGPLALNLSKVPKMLGVLRGVWAPDSFVVSFKLETDERILLAKASGAVERYGVHAVVANLLHTRKDRVLIVHRAGTGAEPQRSGQRQQQRQGAAATGAHGDGAAATNGAAAGLSVEDVRRPPEQQHIEETLVAKVIELHNQFRRRRQQQQQDKAGVAARHAS
ncbi:hypothetical protein Rsub_01103 [Raphidocelis subcapitata]|uniref:DNA/pantothenate metabolism flavoprotein C-terminal domain-containing protein n=1 Tax=Raphidocelis subcapitata TaxID=307507 RepID=A0A2V0NLT0_9CHLO|nr:hypothetical protein Rsub_01103 [Raphidocelis subcapitata]|eukprot:GBF88391.1 hypothetical protein Rsub_01103 [Raphidocelis subcapitata]